MDERKVEVEINVEAEDYRRILYWYHRTSLIIYGILTGTLLLIGSVSFLLSLTSRSGQTVNIPFLFLPAVFVGVMLGLRFYAIWKQSKAIAETNEPTRYTFDEFGVLAVAPSSTAQVVWEKYVSICETKTDFIFFPMKKRFFPFPKRFFNTPEDILALRDLITARLGQKAKLLNY